VQKRRGFGEYIYKSLVLVFFSWELKIEFIDIPDLSPASSPPLSFKERGLVLENISGNRKLG
jgi:hypothetical protein